MSYETGKLLINNKQFKKAYYIFSKLLRENPNDFKINFQMGKMYYELNDLDKSVFYFKRSNKLQPNNSNILFNLALVFQGMGQTEKAKKIYLDLISINSNDVKSYYGLFILNIENITDEFIVPSEQINLLFILYKLQCLRYSSLLRTQTILLLKLFKKILNYFIRFYLY